VNSRRPANTVLEDPKSEWPGESPAKQRQTVLQLRRLFGGRTKPTLKPHCQVIPRVVVDLTPLLPGGGNGGAKPMTLELVRRMAARAPETTFVLLTLGRTFYELAALDLPNIQVMLVPEENAPSTRSIRRLLGFIGFGWGKKYQRSLINRLRGTVLFCPFTAPFFAEPRTPTVSLIHDLQYADYPQYFDEHDRAERQRHFTDACNRAARLICVSEFVRRRVLAESGLPPERVVTVPTQLARRLPPPASDGAGALLHPMKLTAGRYLFYPANFWKHKNHEMLFVAMGLFVRRQPNSDLKLVCTGAPGQRRDFLQSAAEQMGLGSRIVFPGYVADGDFSSLLHNCLALIYPSLYEGFGMPIVEAQAAGKPVLCGDLTSLPEVAGDAALTFDSKLPASIAAGIQRIESDFAIRQELIRKGLANAMRFTDADDMANRYLKTLAEVVHGSSSKQPALRYA
jgi:glycosyltransferase involved in cell wall biosynthesis